MDTPCLQKMKVARPRSRRGHATQLPLERCDVTPAKPPLPALLDAREDALARVLVHGIGAEIQDARNVLAVEQRIVSFHGWHPVRGRRQSRSTKCRQ